MKQSPLFPLRLRSKLTLTYTLVTVLALFVLEMCLMASLIGLLTFNHGDEEGYLRATLYTLGPAASFYLEPGEEDLPGLQDWLDGIYRGRKVSPGSTDIFANPPATLVKGQPAFVLSVEARVLAEAPGHTQAVGAVYTHPDLPPFQVETIIEHARQGKAYPYQLSTRTPDDDYFLVVPVKRLGPEGEPEGDVIGIVVVTLEKPPPFLVRMWPRLLIGAFGMMVSTLACITPIGALFGFVMASGLTRRLKNLATTADAWSEGNFVARSPDHSQDEIGDLAARLHRMAERVQALMHNQQELAIMEERNRLARELHDTVKQQVFAAYLQVTAADNLINSDPAGAHTCLADAQALIQTSQTDLTGLINELRPPALAQDGLAATLKRFAASWSGYVRIPVEVQVTQEKGAAGPENARLCAEAEQALFRVAQEALSNVARHSNATAVTVRLIYQPRGLSLCVEDNGVGFEASVPREEGFGLQSMRDRITALQGQWTVESVPGKGTRVAAWAPIKPGGGQNG